MDVLNLYSISGLFYELYSPSYQIYSENPLDYDSNNPMYRLNALFWAKLFSENNIDRLLAAMEATDLSNFGDIEKAVLANKDLFKALVIRAPLSIINQAITDQMMFAYMEQIEIACRLFSKYLYYPFSLSIQDGFQEPSLSSKALVDSLFNKTKNPYLPFLEENVFAGLEKLSPKIVWINGQPKQSSLTIAAYVKKLFPNVFIAIRYHSSEYFSLNKIDNLLMSNYSLFTIVDCIVLDDCQETCSQIEKSVCQNIAELANCRNIIYIDRSEGTIHRTFTEKVEYSFQESINSRLQDNQDNICAPDYISPHKIVNLKLNPNTACFWNKCSFCAINKKYKFIRNTEFQSMSEKVAHIEKLILQGIDFFWFEDEAIPPEQLSSFADEILKKGLKFTWQARSRIDINFTEDLAKKLYKAGLREIRFGLESASIRVLKLMNKFPDNISLQTVEHIVKVCTSTGIHVHFPMIVGFPTETIEERVCTYTFLTFLREKYKSVSYNINVLMLDVASDLFKNFEKYGINSISFPCSTNEFLGNMVDFECETMTETKRSIDIKRNEFMRETLYPWMPVTAQIKPNIFYRLSETIRNTLVWHSDLVNKESTPLAEPERYKKSDYLSAWKDSEEYYRVYDWITHRLYQFPISDYAKFAHVETITSNAVNSLDFYHELCEKGLLIPVKE